jgi:hypothetical protein
MIPSSAFFDIESWQILTKKFSQNSRICTTETKFSKNVPISLLKNGKISPERKTLDLNNQITQGERDKRARTLHRHHHHHQHLKFLPKKKPRSQMGASIECLQEGGEREGSLRHYPPGLRTVPRTV